MNLRLAMVALVLLSAAPAGAEPRTLKYSDSFRIGTAGVLCTAQSRSAGAELISMFDRGYVIVCRDAAAPVGRLFALRGDRPSRLLFDRKDGMSCGLPAPVTLPEIGSVLRAGCSSTDTGLAFYNYSVTRRGTTYLAEGLAGYDSALTIALRTIVLDRQAVGSVEVSVTAAGDPAAFARVQAGSLDAEQALSEGYFRNNSGSYAEAAAFFDTLLERSQGGIEPRRASEYLANDALQQSNLGNFPEAELLFQRAARASDATNALQLRMLRNFRAIHRLNRRDASGALRELGAPVPGIGDSGLAQARLAAGYIDRPIAQRLNTDDEAIARLGGADIRLSPVERAEILDAQAQYLRGAALRSVGNRTGARAALTGALDSLAAVRQGRVRSTAWLRAASLTELSGIAESEGRLDDASTFLDQAVALYVIEHPSSAALLAARARVAGLMMRRGKGDAAISAYRDIVHASPATPGASQAIRALIAPYFELLAKRGGTDSSATADFFEASQILARPGVAQTQAVLARELSGGSDEASALFRQSVTLSRDIVRAETEIGRLGAQPSLSASETQTLSAARVQRELLASDQTVILAKLAEYPRYRVVASDTMLLADLQAKLRDGEGYYKLVLIGDRAFGVFATAKSSTLFPVAMSTRGMDTTVAAIRDTIMRLDNGVPTTSAFDVDGARRLYIALFGPIDARMNGVTHLIFEPDGPMLQLPVNLLITAQAGVDAYHARTISSDADQFDTTRIAWLGRSRIVSTAVSPRAFVDVRAIAPSRAPRAYLGLGANVPPLPGNVVFTRAPDSCGWPVTTWQHPISANELKSASSSLGAKGTELLTGADFTDLGLRQRSDLNQFRILHFATHGLVTAPRPECPARPALLTSFATGDSDGLLSFREIFDLRLDADTVILSACDTAGMATVAATREAGVATGGNFALDGLVRAFVGAGSRTVLASHWPVPDDFGATGKLMTGLFAASSHSSVGDAMRRSSIALMDDPLTSHPYYWAAFAIVGDATRPLQ